MQRQQLPAGNSHVHPAFTGILRGLSSAPADALALQRTAYVQLLQRHDWEFEHSDDHAAYQRGHNERSNLRLLQRELDPQHALWNQHAPAAHRVAA